VLLQVTVDVPWSPYDTDGRNYDWLKMAAAADLLFIMMYDTQSQVCVWGVGGGGGPDLQP
jgi:di-N-acetylchitobiase